jgi:hypothetical protein
MFPNAYFAPRYFSAHYWPAPAGDAAGLRSAMLLGVGA